MFAFHRMRALLTVYTPSVMSNIAICNTFSLVLLHPSIGIFLAKPFVNKDVLSIASVAFLVLSLCQNQKN